MHGRPQPVATPLSLALGNLDGVIPDALVLLAGFNGLAELLDRSPPAGEVPELHVTTRIGIGPHAGVEVGRHRDAKYLATPGDPVIVAGAEPDLLGLAVHATFSFAGEVH